MLSSSQHGDVELLNAIRSKQNRVSDIRNIHLAVSLDIRKNKVQKSINSPECVFVDSCFTVRVLPVSYADSRKGKRTLQHKRLVFPIFS